MTPERFGYIDAANTFAADFSDGSYLAFMEEKGISMEELEEYSKECEQRRLIP